MLSKERHHTAAGSIAEIAINRMNRSQKSFTMRDAYYGNVGYLNFLNDDFNDRLIHNHHASAMAPTDLSKVLSIFVKDHFTI